MEAHEQVRFRTMFPDSWKKLQRRGATIHQIQPGEQGFHVTVGWIRNRLVSTFLRRFSRKQQNEDSVSWHLFNAYVQQFSRNKKPDRAAAAGTDLKNRSIQWMPGQISHHKSLSDFDNRQNYHIAAAMQLAGIVRIQEQPRGDRLQPTGQPVNAEAIALLDRCVNSSPARLVYEYIAMGQSKKLPSRFIHLVLSPWLCEQLMTQTGIDKVEARHIIEGLLAHHGIENPAELSLENLMEIKNAIRRMGHEHRRVVSAITGQRFIQRQSQYAVSQTPISARSGIKTRKPEKLLVDEGATIDSARDHFIEQLRAAGLPAAEATNRVDELVKTQGIQREAEFTLTRFIALADQVAGIAAKARKARGKNPAIFRSYESEVSVIEYFSRLKYQDTCKTDRLPSRHIPANVQAVHKPRNNWTIKQGSSGQWLLQGHPELEPPECDPDVICDADDEWLIKQQVENGHLIRFAKDFCMRTLRWCGRNKRVIGVQVGLLGLMSVVYGVQTGGISILVMLMTYALSSVAWLAIDTVADRVQRIRMAGRLRKADKARNSGLSNGEEVEDYLDSYSWLTRQHGLTNILNSFKNLQNEVHAAEKEPVVNDTASVIKHRKAQCLAQLRSHQLEDSFGSLDNLVVESVQEISQLDHHFCKNFKQLWQPLEQLDERTLMKVFNDAANSSGIKKHWYLPRQDYTTWLRQTLSNKTTGADRIALFLEERLRLDQPLSEQELQLKEVQVSVDKYFSHGAEAAEEAFKAGKNYVASTLRSTLWRYIESGLTKGIVGTNPTLAGLAPVPTAAGAIFWVYSFAATKITETLNKLHNRSHVSKYQAAHNRDRFDIGFQANPDSNSARSARNDFDNNLLSIRREAKDSTKEFVTTIKQLRKEKQLIDQALQQQLQELQSSGPLSHEQYVARAKLILKHKMLEQKVYGLMNGALGSMHHETVKAASWLQDGVGIYAPQAQRL